MATRLKFAPNFDNVFLVGGTDAVHLWKLNEETRKATNSIIPLGKIKRTISDMVVSIDYISSSVPIKRPGTAPQRTLINLRFSIH